MRPFTFAALALLPLSACMEPAPADAPPAAEASATAPQEIWLLASIDGAAFPATATLGIDGTQIVGHGPCNTYTGTVNGMSISNIVATKMACPDLTAEGLYLGLLGGVTAVAETRNTLTLTSGSSRLVFNKAAPV